MTWNWSNITGQNKSSDAILESGGHVSVYRLPERGILDSAKISSSLDMLVSNSKRQWSVWKSYIRPTLNSLPAGVRDERWDLNPKTDALVYGIQGSTIMVNNDATATSSNGRYWDSTYSRPKTIAEVLEDIFDSVGEISSLSASTDIGVSDLSNVSISSLSDGDILKYNSTTSLWENSIDTGGVSLDGAYDQGGAGAGRSITADSGAITITVPDTSNNPALSITNNDATNDPNTLVIANATSGYSLFLTGSGFDQTIWSDQRLIIGTSASNDGLTIESYMDSGNAAIDILSYSGDNIAEVSIASLGMGSTASVSLSASGNSDTAPCFINFSASNAGSESSYIQIGSEGTDLIRFTDANLHASSWTGTNLVLSSTSTEFDTFKTNFGEVSLMSAVNQAYSAAEGSGVSDWGYLDTTGPSTSAGPTLVYQFDGTVNQLNERVAGVHNLTAFSDSSPVQMTMLGTTIGEKAPCYTTSLTDAERPVGAATCEWIGVIFETSASSYLFNVCYSGEDPINNYLINLRSSVGKFASFIEYNNGDNQDIIYDYTHATNIPLYVVLTRDSLGTTYNLYVNGTLVKTITVTNAPTMGASGNEQELGIGGSPNLSPTMLNTLDGLCSSFRMTVGEEFTQTQVTEVWNAIKPQ